MRYYTDHPSPIGNLLLAANDAQALCGLYFEEHKYFKGSQGWQHSPDHPVLLEAARQLDEYFAGQRTGFELPLEMSGTPFQQAVWRELMTIPFGRTGNYAHHARRIGKPDAVRAVGTAIGRNPLSIIVPCHRVIAASGGLAGYAGGLERKRYLLALEGVNC
jgi:methylated-DNA-[protein]-cysteine S-methyltransferase